jgi:hypothetical protein
MAMKIARTRRRDRSSSAGSQSGRMWTNGLTRLATDFIPLSSSKTARYTGITMSKPLNSAFDRNAANCFMVVSALELTGRDVAFTDQVPLAGDLTSVFE